MHPKHEQYLKASELFVEQVKNDPAIIGIVVCGGWLEGHIDPNSDIDVHLILDPTCAYRERGNTWINGIEIEYFKNPPQQIHSYFRQETTSPHTAFMLAQGEVRYQASPIIEALTGEAQKIIKTAPTPLPGFGKELAKYMLDDYYKDLQDAQAAKDAVGGTLIQQKIINKSIDLFYKSSRKYRPKDKRLLADLQLLDVEFAQIIQQSLAISWDKLNGLNELKSYVDQFLGGPRTKEWKLKGALDL
ncbi:MAG: hypothetical protein Sapg2KO_35180 [Saprospiraceae bacterium]